MLDWITVEGFKSIKRIERLALGPINIVIGSNGSGKSNLIGVFAFLGEIRAGRLQEYVVRSGRADKILHFGFPNTSKMDIHVSLGNEANHYAIALASNAEDRLFPLRETCVGSVDGHPVTTGSSGGYTHEAWISQRAPHNQDGESVRSVHEHLDSWRVYHLHDTSSASPIGAAASSRGHPSGTKSSGTSARHRAGRHDDGGLLRLTGNRGSRLARTCTSVNAPVS